MSKEHPSMPYVEGEPAPGKDYILANVVDAERLEDVDGKVPRKMWVHKDSIKPGPVRHEDIDVILPMLRWHWRHLKSHVTWNRSLEDWELNFMRERKPIQEALIWTQSTYGILEFMHRNPTATKESVFEVVVAIMGHQPTDHVKPKSVVTKIKKILKKMPRALLEPENYTQDGKYKGPEKHLR